MAVSSGPVASPSIALTATFTSGRATLSGAKFQSFTSSDPAKNNLLDIRNYRGQISVGPYQFYMEPKRMRMKQQGSEPLELIVWASSWYGAKPNPILSPAVMLSAVGNEFYGTAPDIDPVTQQLFFEEAPTVATLTRLSRALDDLRRLGETDIRLNHAKNWNEIVDRRNRGNTGAGL